MEVLNNFYKNNESDSIWWVDIKTLLESICFLLTKNVCLIYFKIIRIN